MAISSLAAQYLDQAFFNYVSNHSPTVLGFRSGTYNYNNANLQGTYFGKYHTDTKVYVQTYEGDGDVMLGGQSGYNQGDHLVGGNGSDMIYGGWGNTITTYSGDFLYTGMGGDNFLFAGGGDNWMNARQWGSSGDYDQKGSVFIGGYDLPADPGANFFNAWINAWNSNGGSLAASLVDNTNSVNKVEASDYNDTIITGGGADTIYSHQGDDIVFAGGGNDVIYNYHGGDTIFAEGGNDSIYADAWGGNQYLDGGSGNDYIQAGDNNDQIIGGTGNDTMIGGYGNDQYYFMFGEGSDTIIEKGNQGTDYIVMEDMTLNDYINVYQSNNDLMLHFTSATNGKTSTINIKDYYTYAAQGQTTVEYLYVAGNYFAIDDLAPANANASAANAGVMQTAALDIASLVPEEAGVTMDSFDGTPAGADFDFVRLA